MWRQEETASCRNAECGNHGRSIARHPAAYIRHGRPASGNGQYYQGKACGRKVLVSLPVRLQKTHQSLAANDGKTLVMRLGLERKPLTLEDLLWPGAAHSEAAAFPSEGPDGAA